MGNFFAYPEFQRKFGSWYGGEVGWQVSGPWQTGLSMGSTVGGIFGGLLNVHRRFRAAPVKFLVYMAGGRKLSGIYGRCLETIWYIWQYIYNRCLKTILIYMVGGSRMDNRRVV